MEVYFKRSFKKQFRKLSKKVQDKFEQRFHLLVTEGQDLIVCIHTLKGDKYSMKSMNVTGDYRALFVVKRNTITFYEIGTHSELYA